MERQLTQIVEKYLEGNYLVGEKKSRMISDILKLMNDPETGYKENIIKTATYRGKVYEIKKSSKQKCNICFFKKLCYDKFFDDYFFSSLSPCVKMKLPDYDIPVRLINE